MTREIEEMFGPEYNVDGAGLDKFRRVARKAGSLAELAPEYRRAYGEAVEKAILAKQRSELMRYAYAEAAPRPNCASGTAHSDGAKISAAVRAQHRAKLQACKSRIAGLLPHNLEREYEAAIAAKREAQATLSAAA